MIELDDLLCVLRLPLRDRIEKLNFIGDDGENANKQNNSLRLMDELIIGAPAVGNLSFERISVPRNVIKRARFEGLKTIAINCCAGRGCATIEEWVAALGRGAGATLTGFKIWSSHVRGRFSSLSWLHSASGTYTSTPGKDRGNGCNTSSAPRSRRPWACSSRFGA